MPKGRLPKNARNYAKWKAEQERGPVRTFFHITKNERLPAIKREGLRANSQFANVNSADNPFSELGVEGGGNWVTQRPGAFPVYGTRIGGKNGDAAARADALSTLKIEIPVDKLPEIRAVKDPYGANMHLTKASNKRLFTKFPAWDNSNARVAVLLEDIPPEQLTDLGYVEHTRNDAVRPIRSYLNDKSGLSRNAIRQGMPKADRRALSYTTGHDRAVRNEATSPSRYALDFMERYVPINERRGQIPNPKFGDYLWPRIVQQIGDAEAELAWHNPKATTIKRYGNLPTAREWSDEYVPSIPFGKTRAEVSPSPDAFYAGAISRGMGRTQPITERQRFDWDYYNDLIDAGNTPWDAASSAQHMTKLDWDNIGYNSASGYGPAVKPIGAADMSYGAVSRGWPDIYHEGEPITSEDRYFKWPRYRDALSRGRTPRHAAQAAAPFYKIEWNPPSKQIAYDIKFIPEESIAEGSISRGESGKHGWLGFTLNDRLFNWNTYNKILTDPYATPEQATNLARPFKLNWTDAGVRFTRPEINRGAVSRGLETFYIDPVEIRNNPPDLDLMTRDVLETEGSPNGLYKLSPRQRALRMNWLPKEEW